MDVSMVMNNIKYNFRVGAILEYNNQILIEQGDNIPFVVIPGGRVKLMEDTNMALNREIKEELGIDISNIEGKLMSVIENFFVFDNTQYHELYFVYKYSLNDDFNIENGQKNLDSLKSKYYWKTLDELNDIEILPKELKKVVKQNDFQKYVVRN